MMRSRPRSGAFWSRHSTRSPALAERFSASLSENLDTVLPAVGSVFRLILSIPALLLMLALIPVAACLFLRHRAGIPRLSAYWIGPRRTQQLRKAIRGLSRTSAGFTFSYFLIYAITFCESFIILYLLRIQYPLITALIVTVSDIFPILGPGTVLLAHLHLPAPLRELPPGKPACSSAGSC